MIYMGGILIVIVLDSLALVLASMGFALLPMSHDASDIVRAEDLSLGSSIQAHKTRSANGKDI
jgi:hypothetical protein